MKTELIEARHGRFYINPRDTVVGASLRTYGEYAEHEMMLLSHYAQPGQTAVDVGANIGTHAVFFAGRVGGQGRVFAIEAQPVVFDLLQRNIDLNRCDRIEALNVACGAAAGELALPALDYERDGNFAAFSFRIEAIGRFLPLVAGSPAHRVPVVPLDEVGIEECHCLKIDAEGMEAEVLDGATNLLERSRPVIYLENNHREASPDLIARLFALRYTAYWHVVSYFRAGNFAGAADNIFSAPLELNLVCLPDDRAGPASMLPKVASATQWLPDDLAEHRYEIDDLLALAEMFGVG